MYFAKIAGRTLFGLLILWSASAPAQRGGISVVYPAGVYPDDVTRVQAALDAGGTVVLKAVNAAGIPTSFNFGPGPGPAQSGTVYLNRDVSVVGETVGSHQTTIAGGFNTITGNLPVKSVIRGIDFENPIWGAIAIGASTGSQISDNVFHNVVPVRVRVPSGMIITFAQAIGFAAYDDSGPAPQLISGKVTISRNTIDGAQAEFSNGIQLDAFSADAEILANRISHVNDDTTETGSGIAVIRAQNHVLIVGNDIAPGATQNVGADGIFIGGDDTAHYQVLNNSIRLEGQVSDGIDVAGGDATSNTGTVKAMVTGNSVTLNGGYAYGIFLFDLVTQTQVTANALLGAGTFAIGVSTYGFDTNVAIQNRFTANDLRGFTSSQADLFYDTNAQNNSEIGFCRSVIDLGVGNSSACASAVPSGAAAPTTAASSVLTSASSLMLLTKKQQVQRMQTLGPIRPENVMP